jgi:Carbohydrate binding domain
MASTMAAAAISPAGTVELGAFHVGDVATEAIAVTNTATAPADGLDASFNGSTGPIQTSGTIDQLAAGLTDPDDMTVALTLDAAGINIGTTAIGLASDDGQGDITPLPSAPLTLVAEGYRLAAPSIIAPQGVVLHVGDPGILDLLVQNTAPADGYSESLDASVVGVGSPSGVIAANGTLTGLAAASSDDISLTATVTTGMAGTLAGDVLIATTSDGGGIDGLGTTGLGEYDVPLSYQVNNYATAAIQQSSVGQASGGVLSEIGNVFTLDLGMIAAGAQDAVTGLDLANTAIGPADTLNAVVSLAGDPAFLDTLTNDGTVCVQAGQSLTFDTVDLPAINTGTFAETLTLAETDTNSGGFSEVLPTQTVVVTGTIVPDSDLASPVINNGPTIVLPDAHTGSADTAPLSITNTTTSTAALIAAVGGLTGDATGFGSILGLAPGATDDSSIAVGLNTSNAGAQSGSVALQLISAGSNVAVGNGVNLVTNGGFENGLTDWTGNNGVGTSNATIPAHSGNYYLSLAAVGGDAYTSQTLPTQIGTEYAISLWYWASGQQPDDLNVFFGGDNVLSLTDPPQAGWTQYTVDDVATSADTALTIGGRNDPAADGVDDVSVVAISGNDGVVLPMQTVAVQGTIYREAAPSITGPANLILHVGDGGGSYVSALTITNTDPPDGFSENLDASVAGTSGGAIAAGGTVTGLVPGGTDGSALTVTLPTDTAGTFDSDVMIAATSDGTGIDSLGTTGLGTYDVPVSFQVNNYAIAAMQQTNINQAGGLLSQVGNSYTLDFGTLAAGAADAVTDLNLVNTAIGPADTLNAVVSLAGDPAFLDMLANSGTVAALAGQSVTFDTVDLPTGTLGTFSETLTLNETDTNSGGFSEALPAQTVVVTGTVVSGADLANPVINNGPTIVLPDVHAGTVDQTALSITNASTAAATLVAGIALLSGDATGAGFIADLAPGATDDSSITAGLNTAQAGAKSGTVSLQLVSQGSLASNGGGGFNLVSNGGFENGLAGWTSANGASGSGSFGIPAHSGNYFLSLGAVGGDAHTTQTLATQIGTEYAISLWYWASGAHPDDLNVYFGSDHILSLTDPAQAGWTEYTEDAVATSASTVLDIGAFNNPAWDGVDDVSVVATGTSTAGSVLLPSQTVTVQGNVYREASTSINGPYNLYLHVGSDRGGFQAACTFVSTQGASAKPSCERRRRKGKLTAEHRHGAHLVARLGPVGVNRSSR